MTPTDDNNALHALPRFQQAERQLAWLKRWLWCFAGLSLIDAIVWWRWSPEAWRPVWVLLLATLLLLIACLQSIAWVARWRVQALQPRNSTDANHHSTTTSPASETTAELTLTRWQRVSRAIQRLPPLIDAHLSVNARSALGLSILATLALLLITQGWQLPTMAAPMTTATVVMAAALLSLTFMLLVMERDCANHEAGARVNELPEAATLVHLLRLCITLLLLLTACLLLSNETRQWPMTTLVWLSVLPAILAVEYLLRALLSVFAPPTHDEPELLAESLLAGMWRWPLRPLQHLQAELKQRFGIDLRQSWAFAYIRRALLPVCAVLLCIAWLMSAVIEVPLQARAVYERFGKPVAVLSSGLHLGLPWPLARTRLVEYGVVHELATASASDDSTKDPPKEQPKDNPSESELAPAEGPPPVTAHRLWDASHVAEKSQVIASEASNPQGKQSFQIVNMDVRFMYRIGLSDEAALKATYNAVDVPTLIRSTASRVLVSHFASRTLNDVLGAARDPLTQEIGAQVQRDLDQLDSGVEIMATVVEAIHPPAAAANAYHSVQAAQITAQAIIARERGKAAEQVNTAHTRALMMVDQASAVARETIAAADVSQRRFAAERDAFKQAGKAFVFEQYLGQLSGLANGQLIIVDHRLPNTNTSIDLRTFSTPPVGKEVP